MREKRGGADSWLIGIAIALIILSSSAAALIQTDKENYLAGEMVNITISGYPISGKDISIRNNGSIYRFIGANENIRFLARNEGVHEIAVSEQGKVIDSKSFKVAKDNKIVLNELPATESVPEGGASGNGTQTVERAPEERKEGLITKILNAIDLSGIVDRISSIGSGSERAGERKSDFGMDQTPKVRFEKKFDQKDLKVDIRRADSEKKEKISYLLISSGGKVEVEITERRNIRPGIYRINLSDGKETEEILFSWGLISINTRKPIYHPSEIAEIYLVVLDKNGYKRSGASIELNITDPVGTSFIFSTESSIIEESPGVYYTTFPVNFEGNYTMRAVSFYDDINASIESYFFAKAFYEFDIIRDAPHVIDPWLGPYTNTFRIASYVGTGTFDLVEAVPLEFEIMEAGIETIIVNETKYIIFRGLRNNSVVSYAAQTPLLTPYLYRLGPARIDYSSSSFYEARPWMLAIDPTINIRLNETSTQDYTAIPAVIAMGTADTTENSVSFSIPATTVVTMAIANSSAFGGNGIFIPSGTTMNFGGTFFSQRSANTYVTWESKRFSSGATTFICQAGNNDTGGSQLGSTNNYRGNVTGSCIASTGVRLNSTDILRMDVNIYNSRGTSVINTHYWDGTDTASYVSFNAYILGFLFTNMSTPIAQQNLVQDTPFSATCVYNCTGGSCLNANISVQVNSTGTWQDIGAAGTHIVLNSDVNPKTFSEINSYSSATFNLRTNSTGLVRIRCAGASDFSMHNGTQETRINITLQNYAPVLVGNVSDGGSDTTARTPAGSNVWFYGNATDLNNDLYKLLICSTNSTAAGSCVATTYCQSGFVNSATATNCSHSTTGKSGAYSWYGFACDNQPTPLCSPGNNGTGITGSPFFVNNAPSMTSVFADRYFIKAGDPVLISSSGGSDLESDNLALVCGNETGKYGLCAGALGAGERSCSFGVPWNDNSPKTMHCVLNDTFALSAERTVSFVLDNTAPLVYLNISNNTYFKTGSVVLNFTVVDANPLNCSLHLNGTSNQTKSGLVSSVLYSFTPLLLSDGFYRWDTLCFDNASNRNTSAFGNYSFAVDTTGPNVTLDYPWNNSYLDFFDITFKYNATDLISNVSNCSLILDYRLNATSGNFNRKTVNATFTVLNVSNGEHNWSVNCTDTIGNTKESQTYKFKIFVDEFPPNVTLVAPSDGFWSKTSDQTITYNATDASGILNCSLFINGVLNQTNTSVENGNYSNFTLIGLADGDYNWTVGCFDDSPANNFANATYEKTFYVDTVPPKGNIETPNETWFKTSQPIIYFNLSDNLAQTVDYEFLVDGSIDPAAFGNQPPGITLSEQLSPLSDGNHTIILRVYDPADNTGISATYTIYVDTTPPNATINSPKNNTHTNNATPALNFTLRDNLSPYINYSVIVDGASNNQNGSGTNNSEIVLAMNPLPEGMRRIEIRTMDKTGNINYSIAAYLFVDFTKPSVTLKQPPNGFNSSSSAVRLNYTANDNLAESLLCNVTIDDIVEFTNANVIPGSERENEKTGLSEGYHYWNVTCADNASNANTSATWMFLIDITSPSVRLISPGNNTERTVSSDVVFEYNVSDAFDVGKCELIVNGLVRNTTLDPSKDTTLNFTRTMQNGLFNWSVNCTDTSGNTGRSGTYNLSVAVTDDAVPPNIYLHFPNDGYWNNTGNVSFNYTVFDTSKVRSCSIYIDSILNQTHTEPENNVLQYFSVNDIAEGTRGWYVNCTDNSTNNNTAVSPIRYLKIDKTKPSILMNGPPYGFNTSSSLLSLNYTANDNMATALLCNITLDSADVFSRLSSPGQMVNYTASSLSEGHHYWNVTCVDNATNRNTSKTYGFTNDYSGPGVNLESPANNSYIDSSYTVTFYFNSSDAYTSVRNCSLLINGAKVQTKTHITDGVRENFTQTLSPGQHNWSVNCTDIVGNTNSSLAYNITIAQLLFLNPIAPANFAEVDRDSGNSLVHDNQTLIVHLSNDLGGTEVMFKANLTMPAIAGQRNIVLGTAFTNSTGHASLVWSGKDANSQKMYAGNYTWWAESADYVVNGSRIIYLFGSLNLTYRFSDEDPKSIYGENSSVIFDMFLRSLGPESDTEVNGTYLAKVNLTLTKPNDARVNVELIDPDLKMEDNAQDASISEGDSGSRFAIEHILFGWQNQIMKIGNDRFTEGVIAMNPERDSYERNETAMIKIAVLDEKGYLSEREDIRIILRSGERKIGDYRKEDLTPSNIKGIYSLDIELPDAGNYSLSGYLNGRYITQNVLKIVERRTVEIERKAQIVIDPKKELFRTELTVRNIERYNLTESVPRELEIVGQGSASLDKGKDANTLRWNDLANNTKVVYTAKVPMISPFVYEIGRAKAYYEGNIYEEGRPWILAVDPEIQMQFNETSTASFTDTLAQISLGAYDGIENSLTWALSAGLTHVVNATSATMGSNGIFIPSGNSVTFHSTVQASQANRIYLTFVAERNSNGAISTICQYGDNSTATSYLVPAARTNASGLSCTSPGVRLNSTDRLILKINAFATQGRTLTHWWDNWATTQSYMTFSAYRLGFLFTNMSTPIAQQNLVQDTPFSATCVYNCTGGSCLNANISVQVNSTGTWQDIGAAGTHIVLNSDVNPKTFSEINSYSSATFNLRTNSTGLVRIRCAGASDFSMHNGTQETRINITLQNYAPVLVGNVSDGGSDTTARTPAGSNVWFYGNATDLNNDLYKLLICSTNSTAAGSCVATTYCQSGFVNSATATNCSHSTTGKSGAYSWYGFACDNQPTPLCSPGNNGTGITGSPFFVNNAPSMTSVFADRYFIKAGDPVLISSSGGSDLESDNLALVCGNETGKYGLCAGALGAGERSCSFGVPWNDNSPKTMHCVLNDTFALSAERTVSFVLDNTAPLVYLNISNNTYFKTGSVVLNFTVVDANPLNCSLHLNGTSNQTKSGLVSSVLYSFTPLLLSDGFYRWDTLCFDNASNRNTSAFGNYSFAVDTVHPTVNLISPDPDFHWASGLTVTFQYNVDDITSPIANCSLILNSKINATSQDVPKGSVQEFVVDVAEGKYLWSVNCTDYARNTNFSETRNLTVNVSGDAIPPTVSLDYPANNYWNRTGNFTFRYTPNDNSGLSSCSLIIDGSINQTASGVQTGVQHNFTLRNLANGGHTWSVNCSDYNSNSVQPSPRIFGTDTTFPIVRLESPANNSQWTVSDRVSFKYNASDSYSGVKSCSLILNGAVSDTHTTVLPNTSQTFLKVLSNGNYNWSVNCTDKAGNANRSLTYLVVVNSTLKHWLGNHTLSQDVEGVWNLSARAAADWFYPVNVTEKRQFTYDLTGPNISIVFPENNSKITRTNVTFIYNVTDNLSNINNCSITIDGSYYNTSWNLSQGVNYNFTKVLGYKNHTYSIECADTAGNARSTGLIRFNITYVDLEINSTGIRFGNENPVEGINITVFANIFNHGDENAGTFITKFYEGDPESGGVQFGTDVIILSLNAGVNRTVNRSWEAKQGTYDIFVLVDTPLETNGSVAEVDEGNNRNRSRILVPIWQHYYGNVSGLLRLDKNDSTAVYAWNTTKTSGNIFIADADGQISWLDLRALGVNATNGTSFADFYEADVALNTTIRDDSVNRTFTGGGAPLQVTAFSVFGFNVTNVSYVNSANTSNFITGVFWDSSGRGSFNASQTLVFGTKINQGKAGGFGIYDYEIRVPANLEKQFGGTDSLAFYTDIE